MRPAVLSVADAATAAMLLLPSLKPELLLAPLALAPLALALLALALLALALALLALAVCANSRARSLRTRTFVTHCLRLRLVNCRRRRNYKQQRIRRSGARKEYRENACA